MKAIYDAESNTLTEVYNSQEAPKLSQYKGTLPCDPSCREVWKDGQVLEEGKDYELKADNDIGDRYDSRFVAYPVKPATSEESYQLLAEFLLDYTGMCTSPSNMTTFDIFQCLLEKYTITRK